MTTPQPTPARSGASCGSLANTAAVPTTPALSLGSTREAGEGPDGGMAHPARTAAPLRCASGLSASFVPCLLQDTGSRASPK